MEDPNNGKPVKLFRGFYKENIQPDGSLDKLKLRIVVRGNFEK